MPFTRPTPRWLLFAAVGALLALAALSHGPEQVLRLARGVMPAERALSDLPQAAAWSLMRMAGAYLASLLFAWAVGFAAATDPRAARVILPLLDIGQSVPVLGFFPAALFVFVSTLGGGRLGLELASIFLIFTSQVWNLGFAVYEGLSTIPTETRMAADSFGVRGLLRVRALWLPACVPPLLFNSILSWSNGWYFLVACEIIVGNKAEYDLPGLGSMLASALSRGDLRVALAALGALVLIVVALETLVWRPLQAWSARFRYDTLPGEAEESPAASLLPASLPLLVRPVGALLRWAWERLPVPRVDRLLPLAGRAAHRAWRIARWPLAAVAVIATAAAGVAIVRALRPPWPPEAAQIPAALVLSFLRINAAYALALLWIVPAVLWASDHPRGARALSLLAQIGASIPATAFFPVLVALFVEHFGGMEIVSVALALTGMQWYLLFNLLAGVQRVPNDLRESLRALGLSRAQIHRRLVIPACMPSLVTGSVVAWGGTWNALILSEYVVYKKRTYEVLGVGALLNRATFETGNRALLFLSLAALVVTVVSFNHFVWRRLYGHVTARYRLEG
jgi:NitT/TauT family transport system permease protein